MGRVRKTRGQWASGEIVARRDQVPTWYKRRRNEMVIYTLQHNPITNEVRATRGGYFYLPIKMAPENKDLEHVAMADSPDRLSGEYIDFLLEGHPERCQTTRSLIEEVFEGKNLRKSKKKKKAKKKKKVGYEFAGKIRKK